MSTVKAATAGWEDQELACGAGTWKSDLCGVLVWQPVQSRCGTAAKSVEKADGHFESRP